MPVYSVQGPDGKIYDVQGPEGATADQLGAFITQNAASFDAPKAADTPRPAQQPQPAQAGMQQGPDGAYHVTITGTAADEPGGGATGSWQPDAAMGGKLGGFLMGLRDPMDAGAQMLRRAVPDGVGDAIDALGNKLAALGVPLAPSTGVAGVDKIVNDANAQYDADKAAAGRDGFDWMRLAGNVAATTPLLAAMPSAGGAGLLGRIGIGAAQGTAAGLLTPVIGDRQGDFAAAKRNQGLLGAAGGAIATPIASALGRIVSPVASRAGSATNLLQNEGVQLTPGQAAGGVFQTVEDKLMSAPILGDAIRAARTRANESLNRAVYNRVLAPIGESTDKIGREAVADAQNKIGAFYDRTLANVSLVPDAPLLADVNSITQRVAGMTPTEATALHGIVNRDVIEPLTGVQTIDGPTFKTIESQLTQAIKRYGGSPDAHQQEVGDALSDILGSLRSALQRQNPEQAPMLKAANTAYANLVRLEGAAGKQGAHEGVFTAPQLANAVRQGDASVRKRGYAAGNALMQDLSDAAQSRMSTVIPNSGTTDRLLLNLGALGSGAYNPMIPGGLLAASVPYLPGISRVSTGLITRRPAGSAATAAMLRNLPVGLLGGAAAK